MSIPVVPPANEDVHYLSVQHSDPGALRQAMLDEIAAYRAANPASTGLDMVLSGGGAGAVFQLTLLARPDAGGFDLAAANIELQCFMGATADDVATQINRFAAAAAPNSYRLQAHDFAVAGNGAVFGGAWFFVEIGG